MATADSSVPVGDPAETRTVSLYRMLSSEALSNLWRVNNEEEVENFDSLNVTTLADEALLVWGSKAPKAPEWVDMIRALTDVALDFESS